MARKTRQSFESAVGFDLRVRQFRAAIALMQAHRLRCERDLVGISSPVKRGDIMPSLTRWLEQSGCRAYVASIQCIRVSLPDLSPAGSSYGRDGSALCQREPRRAPLNASLDCGLKCGRQVGFSGKGEIVPESRGIPKTRFVERCADHVQQLVV